LSQVRFVDDQQIGLRDAGAAFSRNFVAAGNVDDLDCVIRQFAAEARGQVVAAGFDEEEVRFEPAMQVFKGEQVRRNVFANGCMRTAAGLDRANLLRFEGVVSY